MKAYSDSSLTLTAVCILQVICAVLATVRSGSSGTTFQCRVCNKAFSLAECTTNVTCDATMEDCYMDEQITDELNVVYMGGCRSKDVCATSIGRKRNRRGYLIACSRCCNTQNDCNRHLCGIKPNATIPKPTISSASLQCRSCSSATTLFDCYKNVTCDSTTEECYIDKIVTDQLKVVYHGGCRSKQVCAITGGGKKRRGSVACSQCCASQDDCNTRLCGVNNATVATAQPTSSSTSLLCRSCNRASTLADCSTYVHCDATTEECYMDQLITDQLMIVHNAGCRPKQVCSGGAIIGKRKRSDLISCSQCCSSKNDCNSHVCGIKNGYFHIVSLYIYEKGDLIDCQNWPGTSAKTCYSCLQRTPIQSHVTRPADCLTLNTCAPNEMCYTSEEDIGNAHHFNYGCYRILPCKTLMQKAFDEWKLCDRNITQPAAGQTWTQACHTYHTQVGSSADVCQSCCHNGLCNYGTCREQNDRLFNLALQGKFDMTTLTLV